MAVLDSVPGLKAEVVVAGASVQEYVDKDEEVPPNTVLKYIEAVSGAEFAVQYTLKPSFKMKHDLEVRLSLDGKRVTGRVLYRTDDRSKPLVISDAYDRIDDGYFTKKFCFTDLTTDDRDASTVQDDMKKTLQDVGSLTIEFYWAKKGKTSKPRREEFNPVPDIGPVPEKALKGRAVSHQASLKGRQPTRSFLVINTTRISNVPIATFKFRYRSKDALKALYIIPRTPSPVPLEDRDPDTMTAEEMRELLKRQREREASLRRVKEESRPSVKREREERSQTITGDDDEVSFVSAKRRRIAPDTLIEDGVEVVDLT